MGILNDISKKAQEYAGIAVDKARTPPGRSGPRTRPNPQ